MGTGPSMRGRVRSRCSGRGGRPSWSPPTLRQGGLTFRTSPTSSTSTCPRTLTTTCTGSVGREGLARRGWLLRSSTSRTLALRGTWWRSWARPARTCRLGCSPSRRRAAGAPAAREAAGAGLGAGTTAATMAAVAAEECLTTGMAAGVAEAGMVEAAAEEEGTAEGPVAAAGASAAPPARGTKTRRSQSKRMPAGGGKKTNLLYKSLNEKTTTTSKPGPGSRVTGPPCRTGSSP
mmetsp:Transcript_2463/g.9042  ORF Transcript_2463/g.9042 Transcript_2463/m.9042 type:complete len:234 (+) Transcript_2463:1055-1756(+)